MPIYEYKCDNCGEVFEVRQKFADEPVQVHEKCGGPVHRLMSTPSFNFKGSGWYVTDYARSGSKKDSDGDKAGDKAKDSSKTEAKGSESKPTESKGSETKSKPETKPAGSGTKND